MSVTSIARLNDAAIYQKNHLVLNNVKLSIERGEFFYLIGKTGSGKSSLLKVLYGDLGLQKGEGKVAGFDLTKLSTSKVPLLRRKLGIVFQDFQLLTDRTIERNLEFVLRATGWSNKKDIENRIDDVLDSVNMLTKKHKMPHEISGGEQQRVAIARSLLNHPELILADEPTGNLDPETSAEILSLLKLLSQKNQCAVLMATHDFHLIKQFPERLYQCSDGKVRLVDHNEVFPEDM